MKINYISASGLLNHKNTTVNFMSKDGIEVITGPVNSGKTLLTKLIFDICCGRHSPYSVSAKELFSNFNVVFDDGTNREYTSDKKTIQHNWIKPVTCLEVSYLGTHEHIYPLYEVSDELIEKFNSVIKKYTPYFDFKFIRNKHQYIEFIYNTDGSNYISDGTMQFIRIITTLMWMHTHKRDIVLIDDVDAYLDAEIQKHLIKIIRELKPEYTHVIMTTKSNIIIKKADYVIRLRRKRKELYI